MSDIENPEIISSQPAPYCLEFAIDPAIESSVEAQRSLSRLAIMAQKAVVGVEVAVVGLEVSPANEAIRLASFVAFQRYLENPVAVGAATGAVNLAIEVGAAVSTPGIMNTKIGARVINWANQKLRKFAPEPGKGLSLPAEAGLAYLGGTSVVQLARQIHDPSIEPAESRRRGLRTATALSAVVGGQAGLVSQGIESPSALSIGCAAFGLAGVAALATRLKNR